ncbi:MAG: hypothetical protein FJY29_13450 [Betaproteobacteria bacterium]|nr:hypothetical protein [Betaproteobacteria bacterium]
MFQGQGPRLVPHLRVMQDTKEFPFKCVLSMGPLVRYWAGLVASQEPTVSKIASDVMRRLERAPELAQPITDSKVIQTHESLIKVMMSILWSSGFKNPESSGAVLPFHVQPIMVSDTFFDSFFDKNGRFAANCQVGEDAWLNQRIKLAYSTILRRLYGIELEMGTRPVVFSTQDKMTNLVRSHSVTMEPSFCDVVNVGGPKVLDEKIKRELLADVNDMEKWRELLPANWFEFHGFAFFRTNDITDQNAFYDIQKTLTERDSADPAVMLTKVEAALRQVLRRPHLGVGMSTSVGGFLSRARINGGPERKGNESVTVERYGRDDLQGSLFSLQNDALERARTQQRGFVTLDLAASADRSKVESDLLNQGVRSMAVFPLFFDDQHIGFFDITSPKKDDLNEATVEKIADLLPLMCLAGKRRIDDVKQAVQSIISEQCTAIHPTVEWRFHEEAQMASERAEGNKSLEMKNIFFQDVYPLYALSTIRNSATLRSKAVQDDLRTQIGLALEVLQMAYENRPMPFLRELCFRLEKLDARISEQLTAGDELAASKFLASEVEPVFNHVRGWNLNLIQKINAYWKQLDDKSRTVYLRRREFDASVVEVTSTLSNYLKTQQNNAQKIFPHYFEKHCNETVEHTIFIGQSLVKGREFNEIYLKNLRLWQLMVMCGSAAEAARMKPNLKVPFDLTHVIVVQDTPVNVTFDFDDKLFHVEGGADGRGEMLKRRVDRAVIKGTQERLAQPGKLSVVFTQERERLEYMEYFTFLAAQECLLEDVEEYLIDEVQGAQGLRALRVSINLKALLERGTDLYEIIHHTGKQSLRAA